MILDSAMPFLGPAVLAVNITAMFLCMRPKRGMVFTICVIAAFTVAFHPLTIIMVEVNPPLTKFMGILYLPLMLSLFKGQIFQKVFAFMMPYQLGALPTHIADALIGITIGYENPHAIVIYTVLSVVMLAAYMTLMLRYGRHIIMRMFVEGRLVDWALYSLGALFSWIILLTLNWIPVGAFLYFAIIVFILWSNIVLCFTIINSHEKAAQAHQTETMLLQMNAMREQTEDEKRYRDDMKILRHDMYHEMGVIMELFRTGKAKEAETVYADWRSSLSEAIPVTFCAEPVLNAVFTRMERKAMSKNINLYVNSNLPDTLPIDTIILSVMVSNALENALTATDKVVEPSKRSIRVKLIKNGSKIGLEVVNPYNTPVEFDDRGLPVTRVAGHGIGVRSIVSFANDNGYLLNFNCTDGKFAVRLLMGLPD